MQVSEGMSTATISVGPQHTLRQAARRMAEQRVGAAVVIDPEGEGPGIITERDLLYAVAEGADPDSALVSAHLTSAAVTAAPDWSMEQAAATMVEHGFRHLVVVDGSGVAGVLSMRDIVRAWTRSGASTERG
jgi:CBS domain-containing protein